MGDINGEAVVVLEGNEILSVSAMGYLHYLHEPTANPELFEIRLKPNYFDLEEVVVTGHYKPVSVDKSIYDIKLIGSPQIENQAANTMAELLSKELTFRINNDPSTGSSLNLQVLSVDNVKCVIDRMKVM